MIMEYKTKHNSEYSLEKSRMSDELKSTTLPKEFRL